VAHKPGFFHKSDLLFAVAVWIVIWIAMSWEAGAHRYELLAELREMIPLAGVVEAPAAAWKSLDSLRLRPETPAGSEGLSLPIRGRRTTAGESPFETSLPASSVRSASYDGKWSAWKLSNDYLPLRLRVEAGSGWTVRPPVITVRGPERDLHLEATRP